MAYEIIEEQFPQLSLSNKSTKNNNHQTNKKSRTIPKPKKIIKIPNMMAMPTSVEKCYRADFHFGKHTTMYLTLDEHDEEYNLIRDRLPSSFVVTKLDKLVNPYIKIPFELKRKYIYNDVTPKLLFHGTKLKHIDSICTYNFNWRLNGSEKGFRHGHGVNFTPRAKFALNFCDKTPEKVIILAEVLVNKTIVGKKVTLVPPKGYDTTVKENGDVYVKFYDSEFCPLYIIYGVSRKK